MIRPFKKLRRAIRKRVRGDTADRDDIAKANSRKFWISLGTLFAVGFASFLFPQAQAFIPISTPNVGDIATDDIVAPFDFPVYKGEAELAAETAEVVAELPAVLMFDQAVYDSVYQAANRLLFMVDSLKQRIQRPGRIADKLRLFYPQVSKKALVDLAESKQLAQVRALLRGTLQERYHVGIAPSQDLVPEQYRFVAVRKGGNEYTFSVDQVLDAETARETVQDELEAAAAADSIKTDFIFDICSPLLVPNLTFSPLETERKREQALASIQQEKIIFKAGQRIIAKNQQITRAHIEWLTALAEYRSDRGLEAGVWEYLLPILGRVAFVAFVFLSYLFAYYHFGGREKFRVSRVFPLLLIVLLTLLAVYLASEKWGLSPYLFPTAAGIMLVAILYDLHTAIITTFANALLLGIVFNFNFEIAFLTIVSGTAVAFSMRKVQRRSDFYRGGLYLALSLVAMAYLLESLKFTDFSVLLQQCGYAALNAGVSTVIAMALLPLFETLFFFTTNITLLELSDMNHPLLKRLALEAPGTYQHSLVVGNLAEAAAEAIGGNSLLARVGAYYHDVGKAAISEYFVENQFGLKSKHDELTPTMSALVIGSHIKRGREMAEEFDLPDAIVEFIEEHHGTSTMTYFYNKAKEQSETEEVPEAEFRYPGPKPQSRETAIMMLADSVEAASRTLDDPKPARIRGLIRRLMNDRYQSGELSQSSLTLSDLQKIEDAFVKGLIGIFHSRIDYPKKEETEA